MKTFHCDLPMPVSSPQFVFIPRAVPDIFAAAPYQTGLATTTPRATVEDQFTVHHVNDALRAERVVRNKVAERLCSIEGF